MPFLTGKQGLRVKLLLSFLPVFGSDLPMEPSIKYVPVDKPAEKPKKKKKKINKTESPLSLREKKMLQYIRDDGIAIAAVKMHIQRNSVYKKLLSLRKRMAKARRFLKAIDRYTCDSPVLRRRLMVVDDGESSNSQ